MAQKYKQLHFVTLQSLVNWSVAHLINRDLGFTKKFPFARIGDVITRSTLLIHVEDDVLYKQVTVKTNGGGAVLRNKNLELGKNIGTKTQYLAREGQFIMSKIDARNGAFGIITNEIDGAIVTSDFPLFDVNTKLVHPFYLYLLSTTKPFIQYAQSCSRGTTNRQRIDVDSFLSQKIPLPSLAEQNKIIAAYNATIAQAKQYSTQAKDIDKQIEKYLQDELEIETRDYTIEKQTDGFLHFINYSTIDKWGTDFMVKNIQFSSSTKYKTKKICQLCNISSGGTPNRGRKEYYGGNIPWIKTGELKNEILTDTEEKITPLGMNNSSAKLYPKGSLVVAMYGATAGVVGLLKKEMTTNQAVCSLLPNEDYYPEFLYYSFFLNSMNREQMIL